MKVVQFLLFLFLKENHLFLEKTTVHIQIKLRISFLIAEGQILPNPK